MVFAIAGVTFLAVFLGTVGLLRPREDPIRRRVLGAPGSAEVDDELPPRLRGSVARRVVFPVISRLGQVAGRLLPQHIVHNIERLLLAADEPWSLRGFLGIAALSAGIGVATLVYLVFALGATGLQSFMLAMLILPVAALLPFTRLRSMARKRQRAITRALPDAMDLLVTSVEAGLGVDAAFALVTEKTRGPIAETFALYLRQVGLGRQRSEALAYVAERTGVPDFIRVARSVNQGAALGTPVGDVLRVQAEELRVARRQRAQIAAQRAPVLMTIPLALCFLPAMGAVVIVPSILNFVRFIGDLGG